MTRYHALFVLAIVLFATGCKKDDDTTTDLPEEFSLDWFYKTIETITVEVAYEVGAEPYIIWPNGSRNVWTITEQNIEALFANRPLPVDVIVPSDYSGMTSMPNQNKDTYTLQEIIDYAEDLRVGTNTETDGNIFLLFLDGYFTQNDTTRQNVLGVNIVGTTITAIFKPVVDAAGGNILTSGRKQFIEQSTIVHELGHALGLVNNGVPLTSQHHDSDNGAHCTNTDCVMYYLNEGPDELMGFVQNYFSTGELIIFGPECIADCERFMP